MNGELRSCCLLGLTDAAGLVDKLQKLTAVAVGVVAFALLGKGADEFPVEITALLGIRDFFVKQLSRSIGKTLACVGKTLARRGKSQRSVCQQPEDPFDRSSCQQTAVPPKPRERFAILNLFVC